MTKSHEKRGYPGGITQVKTGTDTPDDTPEKSSIHAGLQAVGVSGGITFCKSFIKQGSVENHPVKARVGFIENRYPLIPPTDAPTKRAQRRLTRRIEHVTRWWGALPTPRPEYLKATELAQSLGMSMQQMAPALRALGWQRVTRPVDGKPTTLWVPPGSALPPQPNDRRRVYACL